VPKPLHRDSLSSVIQAALEEPPPLDALASSFVGYASLPDVQGRVRKAMLDQAMALSEGNRSRAAELLGVSRQAVQQSLHRRGKADYEEPAS
jgi:DNA-binding NtrC family response regulator